MEIEEKEQQSDVEETIEKPSIHTGSSSTIPPIHMNPCKLCLQR
jgi:hypothetical protein